MSRFLHGGAEAVRPAVLYMSAMPRPVRRRKHCSSFSSSSPDGKVPVVKAAVSERVTDAAGAEDPVKMKVRASVTIRKKAKEDIRETISRQWDALTDKIGWNVVLQLFSDDIEPKTRRTKKSCEAALKDWSEKMNMKGDRLICTAEFMIDSAFGIPGAISVLNRHQKEFFLESIVIEGFPCGPVHFPCNSWIQPSRDRNKRRIFFYNKPFLPSETPPGLIKLREEELKALRGDGTGVRKFSDRIYDYDVYNDLGNPDRGVEFARPVLGGKEFPYPRRCRTGRPPTDSDLATESRVEKPLPVYVPRDETFEELKQGAFLAGRLRAVLHSLVPSIMATISADKHDFGSFHDLDSLYKEGILLKMGLQDHLLRKIPLVRQIQDSSQGLLRYDTPSILSKDKFAWLRDDEFGRQVLAGVNPVNIERVQVFPPISNLDPALYGPPESAFREEHVMGHLHGMTVKEAMENNKLFILDYHDAYLPFVSRINALEGRKAYATRTLFFLTPLGTLKPVAIELSLPPPSPGAAASRRVLSAPTDATTHWLWQLAKAHVNSNDAGVHQLVNHWLRTHACVEPFVLAAHRHLSTMHPVFKLLHPHMRYTLEINALARQNLINADGVIESCFTPGPLCLEISAAAYKPWRFDLEGLPADLLRRGMAKEDPTQPHGLKLLIDDYPYASDGLLIWSAIQDWVWAYVDAYYPTADVVPHTLSSLQNHASDQRSPTFPGFPHSSYQRSPPPPPAWRAQVLHSRCLPLLAAISSFSYLRFFFFSGGEAVLEQHAEGCDN